MSARMIAAAAIASLAGAAGAQPLAPPLTDEHLPRILAHGPWPPAAAKEPSNRVSGEAAA